MTKPANSNTVWWALGVLTVFVYCMGLGFPLVGPDEPRYAQVAREMFERDDWITPTLGGFDWFEKPALLYWLQIVAYKLFGVNEFAARIGSALFGLGTIASLWILGRYSNIRPEKGESIEFANWLALTGATSLAILVFSHAASFEIIVTFPITASLTGFFVADLAAPGERQKQTLGLVAFYFFAGVAVLAKGLIGIVFPLGIVGFYFLFSMRFPKKQFLFSLIWGLPLLVAIAAIWNVPMYLRHGWKFIDEFYIQHHFQRYTSNKYQHPQPFYFYLWVLPLMTLPWLPFFATGVWKTLRGLFERGEAGEQTITPSSFILPHLRFALAWILFPLMFFSVSGSKLPGYILPVIPAAAIISTMSLLSFVHRSKRRRTYFQGIAAAMFILIVCLSEFVVPKYADNESVKRLIETADRVGFQESKIVSFRTLSQNAEFYAAGRLFRDENGKQMRLDETKDLGRLISESEKPILILAPMKTISELGASRCFIINVLTDNGDLLIAELQKTSVPCP